MSDEQQQHRSLFHDFRGNMKVITEFRLGIRLWHLQSMPLIICIDSTSTTKQNKTEHVNKPIDDKWHIWIIINCILLKLVWMIDTTEHRMLLIVSNTSHDQQNGSRILNWGKTVCCCGNKWHWKWEFQMIKHSSFIIHSTFWKGLISISCLASHVCLSYAMRIYSFWYFCITFSGVETFSSVWAKFIWNSISFLIPSRFSVWYIEKYSSSRDLSFMVQQLSIFIAKILISQYFSEDKMQINIEMISLGRLVGWDWDEINEKNSFVYFSSFLQFNLNVFYDAQCLHIGNT